MDTEFSRCSGAASTQAQWKNTGTEKGDQGKRKKTTRARPKTEERTNLEHKINKL